MQCYFIGFALLLALTGCGGGDDITERVVVFGPVAVQQEAPQVQPSPLRSNASDAQRLAEETRLIAFEQSFSLEMNSRHEQSVQRAAQLEQEAVIVSASMDSATTVQ